MFKLVNVKRKGILDIRELTFPERKFTVITGPSGSGKSTLLRLLNNLDSPDAGMILFKNESINAINPLALRRSVVMVPQIPVVFDGTIEDNLQIGLVFSEKEPAPIDEMEKVMKMFELDKPLDEKAEHLSGGEKQRLALARAVLLDPEVFLLDEPTSALDEKTAESVMARFSKFVKEKSKTAVMITHSKEIVRLVAEHVIEVKAGVVNG